jgi:ATP-dependent DNA helicase RecQ
MFMSKTKKDDEFIKEIEAKDVIKRLNKFSKKADKLLIQNGFKQFKSDEQKALLYLFMEDDVKPIVGILPTNSGKSLIYQAGSLFMYKVHKGQTIVISPLISLMLDQVTKSVKNEKDALNEQLKKGVLCLNSRISRDYPDYCAEAESKLKNGKFHLLYVSPERFRMPDFYKYYKNLNILRIVIDEMHCVELWRFRYEYRNKNIFNAHPKAKIILLTASANNALINKTLKRFTKKKPIIIKRDIVRNEIKILPAEQVKSDAKQKKPVRLEQTIAKREQIILRQTKSWVKAKRKILIFTAFAKIGKDPHISAESLRDYLRQHANAIGVKSTEIDMYHAHMPLADRSDVQSKFMKGKVKIMVSTNAFGMGVNIPDIMGVLHVHPPTTIEEYYQEIGRGGRIAKSANPCESLLIWSEDDDDELDFKKSTAWVIHKIVYYMILSQGIFLVQKNDKYFSGSINDFIKKWCKNGLLKEISRNKNIFKTDVKYYKIKDLNAARKICNDVKNNPNGRGKNKGEPSKNERRILNWLNLYCEQKEQKGVFTIPPQKSITTTFDHKLGSDAYNKELSDIEEQGWIERKKTNMADNKAQYTILEPDLSTLQLQQFFDDMYLLAQDRKNAWGVVKKMLAKCKTNDDTWEYLKKQLE